MLKMGLGLQLGLQLGLLRVGRIHPYKEGKDVSKRVF